MANHFLAPAKLLTNPQHHLCLLLAVFLTFNDVLVNGIPTLTDLTATEDDYHRTWELNDDDPLADSQLNHKIVTKSVSAITDKHEQVADTKEDVSAGSLSILAPSTNILRSTVKQAPESEDKQKSDHDSVEIEDGILQEMIAKRRDATHMRIRNSSELHIDNHTGSSNEDTSSHKSNPKASSDSMPKVVFLPKPFHFHIPIVPATDKLPHQMDNNAQQKPSKMKKESGGTHHSHLVNRQAQDAITTELLYGNGEPRNVVIRSPDPEDFSEGNHNLDPPAYANQRETLGKEDSQADASQSEQHKDMDDDNAGSANPDRDRLIDQYPKLMPSINRKRHSHKHSTNMDFLEDESHYHIVNTNLPGAPATGAKDGPKSSTAGERKVKNVNFSQDVVESILGHEDDFLKYQSKIKSHAEKLGLKPEDVFQAVVYGNMPSDSQTPSNIENHELHQRRQQFQKLFFENVEDSKENHKASTIPKDDPLYNQHRYNAYMKILKRNKRGVKSWFKNIFKRNDASTKPTKPTPTTTTKSPKKKPFKKVTSRMTLNTNMVEVDKNGDTEVDFLLPKALRRSTYLKNKEKVLAQLEEEEEVEAEYEKSEEKEQKRRDSRRSKRSAQEVEYLPEIRSRKIHSLSKDEVILVNDMLSNVVESRCEQVRPFTIEALENFHAVTRKVIEISNLPNSVSEVRLPLQNLFSQLLACTEYLSESGNGAPNTRKEATWWNNDTETDSSIPPFDKPLRRTKRVRRGKESSIGTDRGAPTPPKALVQFEDDITERSFINSIHGYLKLHFRFYKLAMDSCHQFVEKELLHDSILHILNEFFKLPYSPMAKREMIYETFQIHPIDMNEAEKAFNDC